MKTIDQGYCTELLIKIDYDGDLLIEQNSDSVVVDKQGARQLIEVLQEWVNDE